MTKNNRKIRYARRFLTLQERQAPEAPPLRIRCTEESPANFWGYPPEGDRKTLRFPKQTWEVVHEEIQI